MNKSTTTEEEELNVKNHHQLSVMHVLQCLSALGLVFFHVHLLEGSHFFLSTDSCMLDKHSNHLPIIGNLLLGITFQMTSFWFASGFFCERQLSQQRLRLQVKRSTTTAVNSETCATAAMSEPNRTSGPASARQEAYNHDVCLGFYDYTRVFFHHLLRQYPLVAIMTVLMFLGKRRSSTHAKNWPEELECSVPLFVQSLLLLVPVHEAEKCMGPGWAVVTEMHGFLALSLLSALVSNRQVRKRILVLAYAASVCLCLYTYQSLQMAYPEAVQRLTSSSSTANLLGYDHFAPFERLGQDLTAEFNLTTRLYSHENFEEAGRLAVQNYRLATRRALYQTSIHKHGSSMLLGCLLYMNLQDRQQQQQQLQQQPQIRQQQQRRIIIVALCKLLLALVLLVATKFLYFMTGTSLYLLADVLLSMRPRRLQDQKQHSLSSSSSLSILLTTFRNNLLILFPNPLFWTKLLAPYTFGIYMVNLVVIMKRKLVIFQHRLNLLEEEEEQQQQEGSITAAADNAANLLCRDYDFSFLVRETIRTFILSLLVSMISHHTLEWPFRHLRQQTWLRMMDIPTTTASSKKVS